MSDVRDEGSQGELERVRAVCAEFDCPEGADLVSWLRAQLSTDTVPRYWFEAVKKALEDTQAVAAEFGCPQGATISDWLREQLAQAQHEGEKPGA